MEDFKEARIWIPGRIPSKKNSKQVTRTGRVISSKKYLEWENKILEYLSKNYPELKLSECNLDITCYFWLPDKRRTDLSNKFESIADSLVAAKLIKDDNETILSNIHLYSQGVNKKYPGVLIIIKPAIPNIIQHPLQEQIDLEEAAIPIKKARKKRVNKKAA